MPGLSIPPFILRSWIAQQTLTNFSHKAFKFPSLLRGSGEEWSDLCTAGEPRIGHMYPGSALASSRCLPADPDKAHSRLEREIQPRTRRETAIDTVGRQKAQPTQRSEHGELSSPPSISPWKVSQEPSSSQGSGQAACAPQPPAFIVPGCCRRARARRAPGRWSRCSRRGRGIPRP